MRNAVSSLKEIFITWLMVMKFAYRVDKWLTIKYYLSAAIGASSPILVSYVFTVFLDQMVKSGQLVTPETVPSVILFLLVAYYLGGLIEDVVYWGLNTFYYDFLLRNKLQNALMLRFTTKLAYLDLQHLEDPEVQSLIEKVNRSYLWQIPDDARYGAYVFRHVVGILTTSLALLRYGWWVPGVVLLVAIPRVYFKVKHGDFVWSMYGSSMPESKKLYYLSYLFTSNSAVTEMRIFQSANKILEKMDRLQDRLYQISKKPLDHYKWVTILIPVGEVCIVGFVVYHFIPQVLQGVLTVGSISFLVMTLQQLRSHVSWGASSAGDLYEKSLFVRPFFELMALPSLIVEKKDPIVFKKIQSPRIEFDHVSFQYPNGREVLKDVSFVVEPGENLALVGVNGAGKSTLIKLLCRFYDVTDGRILVNGVDIRDLKLSHWYSHLGTLFQDFVKYSFTIEENIMLGKPGVKSQKRMMEAAKNAGADEFIQSLPKKYKQILGKKFDNGEDLSGGQWQKLAVARALYQDAPVLIMDEPTSAIDAEAEYEIFNNLEKQYKDKTLILVSHRFSTVRNANKIVVIDKGKIIEEGSHEQLIKIDGKYKAMFSTQAKGYK